MASASPEADMAEAAVASHLVVCCDGTWGGDGTLTNTNIKLLANSFANAYRMTAPGQQPVVLIADGVPQFNPETDTKVAYFDGIGTDRGTGKIDYFADGALGYTIREKCVEAYEFIVKECDDIVRHGNPLPEIYLFGFSRGAHTVRSVAGMINNFGIVRTLQHQGERPEDFEARRRALCDCVYSMYRDRDPLYEPDGPFAGQFRGEHSHDFGTVPAIRFMGLFDTVGALGIPTLHPGTRPQYEFYDQNVSKAVRTVCQAVATHDRLGFFEPSFIRRLVKPNDPVTDLYTTEEVWFPGSHYDIGRQRFVLGRLGGSFVDDIRQRVQDGLNFPPLNAMYTPELANATLRWMVAQVQHANLAVLPEMAVDYIDKFSTDTFWNPLGLLFPTKTIDAYDASAKVIKALVLSFITIPTILTWPIFGRPADDFTRLAIRAALSDRMIPLYEWPLPNGSLAHAKFARAANLNDEQALAAFKMCDGHKFKSQAFKTFTSIQPLPVDWVLIS